MRKKSLILTALAAACLATSSLGIVAVASAEEAATNLATDASLWQQSAWTTSMNYATIDDKGIVFNEYGTSSAVAAVSLKEGLPYEGTISMTFNSEIPTEGNPAGFLKVIFADCSGSANGSAMKPWEISDKVEHLALEVQYNQVTFWQYNAGNVYGTHNQQTVAESTANYIDGKDHTITIEYATGETAYDLKLSIDGTVHFDGEIASTKLYCNNILTIGGYANSTVSDDLTISSVTVEATSEDPAPVIDEDNLLGKADAWTVAENESVVYDATTATATLSAYDGVALTLNEKLPSEAKISLKAALNVAGDAQHAPTSKIRILGNETSEVVLQLDDDGNIWLLHNVDGELVASAGDWAPNILAGVNNFVITVTPELTNGDEDIYISASAGGKIIGLAVNDLGLMSGNQLAILGGTANSVVTFSSVKVEDLVQEKATSALVEEELIADNWSMTGASLTDGVMTLGNGAAAFATYTKALPVNSAIEFTFKATDDASCWYYLDIETAVRTGMWDKVAEDAARFRITTSGTQNGFYTIKLNDTSITTNSATTTDICDGKAQAFKFVTETVADGLKVTLYRNGIEEFTTTYASDTAVGAATGFYLSFVATGAQTTAPQISNLKNSYVQAVDVTAYNEAIATKRAIYSLNAYPTEENAAEVKATAEALLAKLDAYTDEQLEVANNAVYAEYVIAQADAQLAIVADKTAAQVVVDAIAAVNYETITAENVEQAKADLAALQAKYAALTDAQKSYVSNYAVVENLEIAINDYELTIPDDEPTSSEPTDEPTSSELTDEPASSEPTDEPADSSDEPASSEPTDSEPSTSEPQEEPKKEGGCGSVIGGVGVALTLVAAAAIVIKKKED